MAGYHTVKEGDHLSSIAREHGFADYRTIWNHPNNADLKELRQNPNVLFPSDQVYVPDREDRLESAATGAVHQYKVRMPIIKLRLVMENQYEKPIAEVPCELLIGGETRQLTTDADGLIDEIVQPLEHDAILVIREQHTPFNEVQIPVKIGHLDPVDQFSGQKMRLNNLGYFPGDADASEDDQFRSAVEEFQCDHPPLAVDGDCGAKTQEKLKQVHGC